MAVTESIDAVVLPDSVEQGAVSVIIDPIEVMTGYSGLEQRNQTSPTRRRRRWKVGYAVKTETDAAAIRDLYNTNGQTIGFLFKDWSDYSVTSQNIGTGDGVTLSFNAKKVYSTSARSYSRRLTRPILSTIVVTVDGIIDTHWTLQPFGVILFDGGHAPANTKAVVLTCQFQVAVRFNGEMSVRVDMVDMIAIPSVELIELFETASG